MKINPKTVNLHNVKAVLNRLEVILYRLKECHEEAQSLENVYASVNFENILNNALQALELNGVQVTNGDSKHD